jgi:hypothetical protein
MSLLDIVQQHLGPDQIQQISQHLGTDPATTSNAIQAALPMLVGGMAHTAQQPGGAAVIQNAVDDHGAGGILGSLGGLGGLAGMLGGASQPTSGSTGGLGGILQQAANAAQQNTGGSSQVGGVLGQILGGLTHS